MATLRWGLIGCGDIARKRVAPALRDAAGSELAAVSRARSELAAEFAREFGAQRHHARWQDLIADPDVDAVYVATPVDLHAEQATAAAAAGKHVLCEKPMALDVASCDPIIAAAKAGGVRLGVAYYRRFYPVVRRIRELIAEGEIGRPVLVQINAFERFNPKPGDARHWLVEKRRSGGGPMMDFGSHRLEILCHLFGRPNQVTGFVDRILYEREVEDTAVAVLSFPSGVRAQLTVTHATAVSRDTLAIYGSEGALRVGTLNEGDLTIENAAGSRLERHPPHANLHQPLVEDFVRAVAEGRDPSVDGAAGREVQRMLAAVYDR